MDLRKQHILDLKELLARDYKLLKDACRKDTGYTCLYVGIETNIIAKLTPPEEGQT